MAMLESVFSGVARAMHYVATAFLLFMASLVILSSFMRYFVGRPLHFTEELVALMYMALVFLSVPIATVRHAHVSITVLPQRLMTLLRYPLRLCACLVMIAFSTWFAIASYGFTAQSYRFASRTEQAELLLWPWMAIIPITMAFVAVISTLQLFQSAGSSSDTLAELEGPPVGDAL